MSNCNTSECCFHGIDLVIKCYDPLPDFNEFKVPTWWFNRCNGKLFLLKDIIDGKAIWEEITGHDEDAIHKILTDCGIVEPNKEGKIQVKGTCGIRAIADPCEDFCFVLRTGFGLKGGGQICNGEEREIALDAEITGDMQGPNSANVGDVPVFKDKTGKSITTSNINSVDGLTKITKTTKGEQKLLVENLDTEASSNAGIIAKSTGSAFPYFELTKDEFSWRSRLDPSNGNYQIRPTGKDPILTMLPNGVMIGNLQPKSSARLTRSTPIFEKNKWFQIGSNLAFEKLRDEDGYNKSANNFFIGDGAGKGAFYTFPYKGVWAIQFQFLIDQSIDKTGTRILYRLTWGKEGSYQSLRNAYQLSWKYQPISDCRLLPIEQGDTCFLEVRVEDSDEKIKPFIYAESDIRSIDSYIGFFLVTG